MLTLSEMPALVTSFPCAPNCDRGVTLVAPVVSQVKIETGAGHKEPFSYKYDFRKVEYRNHLYTEGSSWSRTIFHLKSCATPTAETLSFGWASRPMYSP